MTQGPQQPGGPPPPGGWGPPPGGEQPPPGGWGPPPGGEPARPLPAPGASGPAPGEPPRWQQLPPEQLTRLHQPGIVPLRPLHLGDMFGGALQTMRRNPEATIGMGLVVLAVLLIPSLLLSLLLTRVATGLAQTDLTVLTTLLNALSSTLASVALTGMIVHVVGEAVLGDRAGLGETWRATRRRIPALLGNVVLLSLLAIGFVLLGILAVVALVVAAESAGGSAGWAAVLIGIPLFLAMLVLGLWAGCRLSLAPAPVVLEQLGPWRALRRAWSLTRGKQGWRVTGITLLAGLVTNVFTTMVQVPLVFATMLLLGPTGLAENPVSPALLTLDHLTQLVVGAIAIPFTAGVTALLYLDQRIRREGLDVVLVRAAQDRAAARQR